MLAACWRKPGKIKELIDNALDAAESAGIAPAVLVEITESPTGLTLAVANDVANSTARHWPPHRLALRTASRTASRMARFAKKVTDVPAWLRLILHPRARGRERVNTALEADLHPRAPGRYRYR